jgi:hypothetical protein
MNNNSNVLLQSKINYEYFAEIHKPLDPVQQIYNTSKTLEDIKAKLTELTDSLNRRYPNHVDFYYTFNYTHPSNGCYEAWFNLYGVTK